MENTLLFCVKDILSEIYSDDIGPVIEKLDRYQLLDLVNNKLKYLQSKISGEENSNIDLNVFSTSLIISINNIVFEIEDVNDKIYMQYVLGDLGRYLVDSMVNDGIIRQTDLVKIQESLKITSEVNEYDYEDIEKHLRLNTAIGTKSIKNTISENGSPRMICFEWLKEDILLNELAYNLKSDGAIKSVRGFKKLFSAEPKKVQVNPKNVEFIVILFDVLHEKKILKPRGNKGHFLPLKIHLVDFENNSLFKREIKTIKNTIKKNKGKYERLRAKAIKWIS